MSVQAPADVDTTDETDTFTHRVAAATTNALEYRGVTASLTVNLKEAAITLDPATALTLAEGASAAAAYTVKLAAPPSDTVTVTVARSSSLGEVEFSDAAAGTYAGALALSFTTENWDTAQTVYVKAGQDDDAANDSGNITHTANAAGGYTASIAANRAVTVTDDDPTQAVTVPSPKLVMAEGDATYTVKLSRQPGATVTATIARAAGGAEEVLFHTGGTGATYSAASKTLSFTTGNWDTTQTVYVRANDTEDAIETDTLSHTLSGGATNLGSARDLEVEVRKPGIVLSATGALALDEGSTANYTVKLNAPPSAAVTVTVSRDATAWAKCNSAPPRRVLTPTLWI